MALTIDIDADITSGIDSRAMAGVRRYLEAGADKGHAVAIEHVPVDKGTLQFNLAEFTPTWRGNTLVWGVSGVPYALDVEEGTEPFEPSPQEARDILEWSRRVSGGTSLGGYVIQTKFPEEGQDAQPYLEPGAEAQQRWYDAHEPSAYIDREFR